ncbi:MAG: hypothetical protein JWN08_1938 [Frankiales bacterium]|nr:hypothetical protein [Frankiales bacterium]
MLFGDVVDQPRGSEGWHRVAIVRYPTVQSFLQMQEKADFIERHQHQDAGREESAVIATCTSLSGGLEVATGPLLVDLVTTDPEAVVARAGEAVLRVDHILIGDATDPAVPGCRRSSVPAAMGRRAGLACAKDVRKRAPWEARLRKTAGQSRCRALSALAR